MTKKNRALLDAAVALPETQRVRFIQDLVDSLTDSDEFWEQHLANELNRRHKEIKEGTAKPISWAKLKKQLTP